MRTIRRIYFYLVSLVSLEVILWGVIGLARTAAHLRQLGGTVSDLSGSLALTLVGLPVFLLHWGMAQRSADRDMDERTARTRGVFFYAALVGMLIPAVQSGMAMINRLLLTALRLPALSALVGGNQDWADNLIAILVNGVAAIYLVSVLKRDRQIPDALPSLNEVRRLYRAVWLLYGLGLTILGVQLVVGYILTPSTGLTPANGSMLANAFTLLIAGLPLWLVTWRTMQAGLDQPGERGSLLRLVVLYLLSLAGVGTVLTTAGLALAELLRKLLGEPLLWTQLLTNIRQPLSLAVPLGGVWAYYGRILRQQIAQTPDENRRMGLRRLYNYILSAFGVGATVSGLILLTGYLVSVLVHSSTLHVGQTSRLANALAVLAVGLPLWLSAWRPMVQEAHSEGDDGDHARRSPIRKTYLYLTLFAGVIGSMVSAWQTLSPVFKNLFGNPLPELAQVALSNFSYLLIFLVFLTYHLLALRSDGRAAARALSLRHSRFAVLVIAPENGWIEDVRAALQRQAPNIPMTGHSMTDSALDMDPHSFSAVVLQASLAVDPPDALRSWLSQFNGERLVAPDTSDRWAWVGSGDRSSREWADQTAQALRLRAEGQPLRAAPSSSPWVLAGYIFGALFAVEVIFLAVTFLFSTLMR